MFRGNIYVHIKNVASWNIEIVDTPRNGLETHGCATSIIIYTYDRDVICITETQTHWLGAIFTRGNY